MRSVVDFIPGILWVGLLAFLAVLLAGYFKFSETLVAILLGFVLGNVWRQPESMVPGIHWSECQGLSIAVALLGVQLNANILTQINGATLVFIAVAMLFTFVVTVLLAKWWRIQGNQACLLASGQAICGSAAVMATQNIVKAPAAQVGMTVGLVNFLGFLGIFITTWMATYFDFNTAVDSGLLIGNTLQSMGHVVAAGFSISDEAGHAAVLVKMCRILFLVPVLLILIVTMNPRKKSGIKTGHDGQDQIHWLKLVPLFIWVFLLLSFLSSMGWVPNALQAQINLVSDAMFVMAMVAIGLNISINEIRRQGRQLLLLGGVVFILQLGFTTVYLFNF